MAAVEENDAFVLTETRLTRLHGGDGKGDHGEATDELGNTFSQWRVRMMTATHGREWRTAVDLALRAEKARERQWSGERVRAGTGPLLERGRAMWRPRQRMNATQRASPEPVGHGDTDRFLKMAIQCSMVMTDSTYSTRQHG